MITDHYKSEDLREVMNLSFKFPTKKMLVVFIFAAVSICVIKASPGPAYSAPPVLSRIVQVSLERNNQPLGIGVIIGSKFVLTTASPLLSTPQNEIAIVVKDNYQKANYTVRRIDYYYDRYEATMPNGGSRLVHNIAVIHINGIFDFVDMGIASVRLVEQGYKAKSGEDVSVRGFDADREPVLQYMQIVSSDECNEIFRDQGGLYQGELCAGSTDFSLCKEDEGSSLLTESNRSLLGIASWLNKCPDEDNHHTVFLDIGFYHEWINATMNLMLGAKSQVFTNSWSEPWLLEKWFEEWRKDDVSCEIGPKREIIRWDHCYRGCDVVRGVNGECVDNQCTCPNMAGDLSLYNLIHNISRPNWKNPYCGRRPC